MVEDTERAQLKTTIRALEAEIERLKDEIRRLRQERDERPPHYQ